MNKLKPGHFKAYVWDYNGDKLPRIIVDTFKDNSCYVVEGMDETNYYEGKTYCTNHFGNFEKIKEPQMRPMTNKEMISFLLENNVMIKHIDWKEDQYLIHPGFDETIIPEEWLWRRSFNDEYQGFTIEDKNDCK